MWRPYHPMFWNGFQDKSPTNPQFPLVSIFVLSDKVSSISSAYFTIPIDFFTGVERYKAVTSKEDIEDFGVILSYLIARVFCILSIKYISQTNKKIWNEKIFDIMGKNTTESICNCSRIGAIIFCFKIILDQFVKKYLCWLTAIWNGRGIAI